MKRLIIMAVACAAAFSGGNAGAAQMVTVHLDISFVDDKIDVATCDVTVAKEASGIKVLDAAVATGCLDSYEKQDFGFGAFVTCIDQVCGQDAPTWAIPVPTVWAGSYWSMTVNDSPTIYGVSDFEAVGGEELGFSYTPYAFPA